MYGEPRLEKVSGWSQYWRYRKQAEKDIETGRASQARQNLRAALVALGRPPPLTWLDIILTLYVSTVKLRNSGGDAGEFIYNVITSFYFQEKLLTSVSAIRLV